MQTTTLPSNPLSVSLGTFHQPYLRRPDQQHRGNSLPGHHERHNVVSEQPPGVTELSTTDFEEDDEENSAHNDRPLPKVVNNYSGKYTREEILSLHRLDFPVPPNFTLEEDITSKSALEPVAFSPKYSRKPQEGLRESQFFAPGKSSKGRGRGRRFIEEHDPRYIKSEPTQALHDSNQAGIPGNLNSSITSSQSSQHVSSGNPQTSHSGGTSSSTHHYNSSSYPFLAGEDFILDDEKWYYKDPKGLERGPFGSMQMDKWVKYGYFKVDLMVRRENSDYVYLGDIFFSEGRNPFTGEALDHWFSGPSSEFKISLMMLIQNYNFNRQKQDAQTVEYQMVMNHNPGEVTTYQLDPYQSFNVTRDSQPIHKSGPSVTSEVKPNVDTITINEIDKQEIKKPSDWHLTSSEVGPTFHHPNHQTQPPPSSHGAKDWNTLQQEQTISIQQIVAQMNNPKKPKKKKGKKPNPTNLPSKPSQNVHSSQKKPEQDIVKPTTTNTPGPKSNSNTTQTSHINTQKNTNQPDNKNKTQSPPQPHPRQSINKKPKPQYKVKEPSPEPEPQLIQPHDENITQSPSQTQFSKRQNVRQPKVWKRKDEGVNDEHN